MPLNPGLFGFGSPAAQAPTPSGGGGGGGLFGFLGDRGYDPRALGMALLANSQNPDWGAGVGQSLMAGRQSALDEEERRRQEENDAAARVYRETLTELQERRIDNEEEAMKVAEEKAAKAGAELEEKEKKREEQRAKFSEENPEYDKVLQAQNLGLPAAVVSQFAPEGADPTKYEHIGRGIMVNKEDPNDRFTIPGLRPVSEGVDGGPPSKEEYIIERLSKVDPSRLAAAGQDAKEVRDFIADEYDAIYGGEDEPKVDPGGDEVRTLSAEDQLEVLSQDPSLARIIAAARAENVKAEEVIEELQKLGLIPSTDPAFGG